MLQASITGTIGGARWGGGSWSRGRDIGWGWDGGGAKQLGGRAMVNIF